MRRKLIITLFLSIFVMLAVPGYYSLANAAVMGVDVSKYQGTIDWNTAQNSFSFAFIKAGGSDDGMYTDPQFARNRDEARRLGIARGYYYYAGGGDPIQEADHFYSIMGPLQPGEVIAMDFEIDHPYPIGYAQAFLLRCGQLFGVRPIFYTNMNRARNIDWTPLVQSGYQLWGANYDDNYDQVPSGAWPSLLIKQFTSDGVVPGISGPVDVNVYEQNFDYFQSIGYKPPAPPPPPPAAQGSAPADSKAQKAGDAGGGAATAPDPAAKIPIPERTANDQNAAPNANAKPGSQAAPPDGGGSGGSGGGDANPQLKSREDQGSFSFDWFPPKITFSDHSLFSFGFKLPGF